MEKDNFEAQLKNIVFKADQNATNASGRERVWVNVQPKKKNKMLWYAAAAVVLVFFALALYQTKAPLKITVARTRQIKNLPKAPLSVSEPKEDLAISSKSSYPKHEALKQTERTVISAEKKPEVNLVETKLVDPISEPQPAIIKATVETIAANHPQKENEPELTVQFKRGTIAVKNNNDGVVFTALKKFKLKRDTTYFANSIEKHPSKIKLSF